MRTEGTVPSVKRKRKKKHPLEGKAVANRKSIRKRGGGGIDGRTVKACNYARLCKKEVWVDLWLRLKGR